MKKIYFVFLVALLTSCSTSFYQVYTVQNSGLTVNKEDLVYENEDCKVTYNLWAEGGDPGFVFTNKTNKDIFIIMPQSFFIRNNFAFDYYQNREYHKVENTDVSAGGSGVNHLLSELTTAGKAYVDKLLKPGSTGKNALNEAIYIEVPTVCVPAHTSKAIAEYRISKAVTMDCDAAQMYPKEKSVPVTYNKEESPLTFQNRISYSFYKDGRDLKSIENGFWVSEMVNYSSKEFLNKAAAQPCEGNVEKVISKFKVLSPGKFYNSYTK